jgi:hypothetical protein
MQVGLPLDATDDAVDHLTKAAEVVTAKTAAQAVSETPWTWK